MYNQHLYQLQFHILVMLLYKSEVNTPTHTHTHTKQIKKLKTITKFIVDTNYQIIIESKNIPAPERLSIIITVVVVSSTTVINVCLTHVGVARLLEHWSCRTVTTNGNPVAKL